MIVYLKVYPARNALIAYSFLKVLKVCDVEEILLDKGQGCSATLWC